MLHTVTRLTKHVLCRPVVEDVTHVVGVAVLGLWQRRRVEKASCNKLSAGGGGSEVAARRPGLLGKLDQFPAI